MATQPHECRESRTCCCWIGADEPNESCPVHGAGEWPPRCEVCGRFVARPLLMAQDSAAEVE